MSNGRGHNIGNGQKTLQTIAIHLAIITVGFFLISTALRERFDLRLYLVLVCISVARDGWQAWKESHVKQYPVEVTYQETEEGIWPPPPRRPKQGHTLYGGEETD